MFWQFSWNGLWFEQLCSDGWDWPISGFSLKRLWGLWLTLFPFCKLRITLHLLLKSIFASCTLKSFQYFFLPCNYKLVFFISDLPIDEKIDSVQIIVFMYTAHPWLLSRLLSCLLVCKSWWWFVSYWFLSVCHVIFAYCLICRLPFPSNLGDSELFSLQLTVLFIFVSKDCSTL